MKDEIEQHWRDLGSFIRDQRHVGQLSLRKLSEMAGISNPYLSQIERGLRKPSAEILRQIASALHISAETLYVRAGILDEPGAPADLIAEIRRSPDLNEEHKRALVQLYEMFQREHAEAVGRRAGDDEVEADDAGGAVDVGADVAPAATTSSAVPASTPKPSTPRTSVPKNAAVDTTTPRKTASKKSSPKKAASKKAASKKAASKKVAADGKATATESPIDESRTGD